MSSLQDLIALLSLDSSDKSVIPHVQKTIQRENITIQEILSDLSSVTEDSVEKMRSLKQEIRSKLTTYESLINLQIKSHNYYILHLDELTGYSDLNDPHNPYVCKSRLPGSSVVSSYLTFYTSDLFNYSSCSLSKKKDSMTFYHVELPISLSEIKIEYDTRWSEIVSSIKVYWNLPSKPLRKYLSNALEFFPLLKKGSTPDVPLFVSTTIP